LKPYEFHAERWLEDKRFVSDNRKARQPFSAGPRNCIGKNLAYAEMRLLLASLLWHFDLELAEESKDWMERNQIYVLWLKPELKVKLTPRIFS
jgi:cytochrome P450